MLERDVKKFVYVMILNKINMLFERMYELF